MAGQNPAGMLATAPAARVTDRVVTVPNLVSLGRLCGVPVFLYLLLGPHADGWALAVLAASGVSDWLDGRLARALGQQSRLGQLLDPLADRLYIAAAVVALTLRSVVPVALPAALLVREAVLAGCLLVLRRHGYGPLPVHYLGKAATLNLLYAFPLLLVGQMTGPFAAVAAPLGWAFVIWGTSLYWWAGALYLVQVRRLVAPSPRAAGGVRPSRVGGDG